MFAGFPYKSRSAPAKLHKISRVVIWWTLGRVVWGIVVLTTILQGWLTHAHRDRQIYSLVLVGLFLLTELIPYIAALDQDLLALIATDARGANGGAAAGTGAAAAASSRYGTVQQGLTPVSLGSPSGVGSYGPPTVEGVGGKDGGGEEQALCDAVDAVVGMEEEGKVRGKV